MPYSRHREEGKRSGRDGRERQLGNGQWVERKRMEVSATVTILWVKTQNTVKRVCSFRLVIKNLEKMLRPRS